MVVSQQVVEQAWSPTRLCGDREGCERCWGAGTGGLREGGREAQGGAVVDVFERVHVSQNGLLGPWPGHTQQAVTIQWLC